LFRGRHAGIFIGQAASGFSWLAMKKTLYGLMDYWTLFWDDIEVEMTLTQLSDEFSRRDVVFFVLENLWNAYETTQDPLEYMTDERKTLLIVRLLRDKRVEHAAKALKVETTGPPDFEIKALNAGQLIEENPSWFREFEGHTLDEAYDSLFDKKAGH
jgi:hypothetical protein